MKNLIYPLIIVTIGLTVSACSFAPPLSATTPTSYSTDAQLPKPTSSLTPIHDDIPTPQIIVDACGGDIQKLPLREVTDFPPDGIQACYVIEFDITVENEFSGKETILFFVNNKDASINDIVLRTYANANEIYGGELSITSIDIDQRRLTPMPLLDDGTAYRVTLPDQLKPGEAIKMEVAFQAKAPINFQPGNGYGIFNYDHKNALLAVANGYPLLAEWENGDWSYSPVIGQGDAVVSDTSLYRVFINAPTGTQVASTGTIIARERTGNQEEIEIVTGPARDFLFIASPNLQQQTHIVDHPHSPMGHF
ncbi:MAG: hypothetical protein HPY76_03420 [Anaerolineae bacterium]|nr:hypothetical protein [Anaerolineae bacterium]